MFGPLYKHLRERPVHYRAEPGSARPCTDFQMRGITSGTRIATAKGWRKVEHVAVGDQVLTFDNGPQEVIAITRATQFVQPGAAPEFAHPIDVPAGVLGNAEPMVLLPEQNVMIESDEAEALCGDPFALIPAKALVGYRGVERFRALRPFEVVTLHFANDEVIYAEGGAHTMQQHLDVLLGGKAFSPPTHALSVAYRARGDMTLRFVGTIDNDGTMTEPKDFEFKDLFEPQTPTPVAAGVPKTPASQRNPDGLVPSDEPSGGCAVPPGSTNSTSSLLLLLLALGVTLRSATRRN